MLVRRCLGWQTSVAVSVLLLTTMQPLAAESASDCKRIEELERTVAELKKEIAELKKQSANYIHTWSDFRQANPEFGEDQFDEVIGRVQLMF
jgi:hypothetical protein